MNRKRMSFLPVGVVVLCGWMAAPAHAQVGHTQGMGIPDNGSVVGDTSALAREAQNWLVDLIKINTTNPPGNELAAAKFLKDKFLADGIPATTWEPLPGRGIVAARLHGIGKHHNGVDE